MSRSLLGGPPRGTFKGLNSFVPGAMAHSVCAAGDNKAAQRLRGPVAVSPCRGSVISSRTAPIPTSAAHPFQGAVHHMVFSSRHRLADGSRRPFAFSYMFHVPKHSSTHVTLKTPLIFEFEHAAKALTIHRTQGLQGCVES
jgi:hypothetical protein